MSFTRKQLECLAIAKQGHNLAILGQAGVGKTFIVSHLKNELELLGLNVAVTCTTGIACSNYNGAITIHRFCGIKDGRYSLNDMEDVLEREDALREKICSTDVLIIDEISMLSYKMLSQVEAVCRMARKNKQMFGGLQMIVCGDFFQLQPVPNLLYGDRGDFAFSGPLWNDAFPHHIILSEVIRQKEHQLIDAIRETSRGTLSEATEEFLTSLSRPLTSDQDFVKICATNQQADVHNQREILRLKGDLKTFHSEDWGEKKYLDRLVAPKCLWVKVGCKVMLLRNLSDHLVNGCTGVVTGIGDTFIDVNFQGQSSRILKYTFGVYNPQLKCDVAKRCQFPLKLCYAFTIHKSQGMTIDRLQVDCEGLFRPGQLGVAIGRARSIEGLQVLNFHPHWVIAQEDIIFEFYERESMLILDNMECCQHISVTGEDTMCPLAEVPTDFYNEEEDLLLLESYDKCFGEDEHAGDQEEEIDDVYHKDEALNFLKAASPESIVTLLQTEVERKIGEMEQYPENVVKYCNTSVTFISKAFAETVTRNPKNENVNDFYLKCHSYLISDKHTDALRRLFGETSKAVHHICYKIFKAIRERFLHSKSEEVLGFEEEDVNPRSSPSLNDASRAKVRYISGYCFHKIEKNCSTGIGNNIFKLGPNSLEKLENSHRKKMLIRKALRKQRTIIGETADYASLSEVLRKQNMREGLTHVSDVAFDFSVLLAQKCINLQTDYNLNRYGKHFHLFVSTTLQRDSGLFQKWLNVFQPEGYTEKKNQPAEIECLERAVNFASDIIEIFNDFTETFVRIMSKQFVRDILEKKAIKKKEAHRKEIKIRKDEGVSGERGSIGDAGESSGSGRARGGSGRGRGESSRSGRARGGSGRARGGSGRARGESSGSGRASGGSGRARGESSGSGRAIGGSRRARGESSGSGRARGGSEMARGESSGSGRARRGSGRARRGSGRGRGDSSGLGRARGGKVCSGKGKGRVKKSVQVENPCGICGDESYIDCVACDMCDKWYHGNCLKIYDLDSLPDEWFCPKCEE